MPTSPLDILALAKQLHQTNTTEAGTRSTISRAYYAGLHTVAHTFGARERLNNETSHGEIIGRAEAHANANPPQPGRTAASQIAQAMHRLRRSRNAADYHLHTTIAHPEAEAAIKRTEHVIALCAEVESKLPPTN